MGRVMKALTIIGLLLIGALVGCANRGGAANSEQRSSQADALRVADVTDVTDVTDNVFVPFEEHAFLVAVEPDSSVVEQGDPYDVTVTVSGNDSPVSYVELFLDGESVGQQNVAPYRFEGWFVGAGAFELVALTKLEDNSSAVSTSVSIKVTR